MSYKRWKREELRVARVLGLERLKRQGEASPDLKGDWLVVEVKDRIRHPGWIELALAQVRNQAGQGQLGIVVLTSPANPKALVVIDLLDFRDWFVPSGRRKERDGE